MKANSEFDIWKSIGGSVTAKPSSKQFVDDSDAPYGYDSHEVRIEAGTAKIALRKYHELKKG